MLELDVRVTAAGDLVTLHDPTLERTVGDPRRHDELVDLPDHPAAPATLEAVLDRHADHAFLVDLKDPEPAWEQRVVEVLDRRALRDRAMVQSFDLDALGRLHASAPWLRIAALYRRADSVGLDVADVPAFAAAVGVHHPVVDEAFVAAARERALAVHPWTVDDVAEAERLVALGVEGVITNVPGVVGETVRQSADDRTTLPLRQ